MDEMMAKAREKVSELQQYDTCDIFLLLYE